VQAEPASQFDTLLAPIGADRTRADCRDRFGVSLERQLDRSMDVCYFPGVHF